MSRPKNNQPKRKTRSHLPQGDTAIDTIQVPIPLYFNFRNELTKRDLVSDFDKFKLQLNEICDRADKVTESAQSKTSYKKYYKNDDKANAQKFFESRYEFLEETGRYLSEKVRKEFSPYRINVFFLPLQFLFHGTIIQLLLPPPSPFPIDSLHIPHYLASKQMEVLWIMACSVSATPSPYKISSVLTPDSVSIGLENIRKEFHKKMYRIWFEFARYATTLYEYDLDIPDSGYKMTRFGNRTKPGLELYNKLIAHHPTVMADFRRYSDLCISALLENVSNKSKVNFSPYKLATLRGLLSYYIYFSPMKFMENSTPFSIELRNTFTKDDKLIISRNFMTRRFFQDFNSITKLIRLNFKHRDPLFENMEPESLDGFSRITTIFSLMSDEADIVTINGSKRSVISKCKINGKSIYVALRHIHVAYDLSESKFLSIKITKNEELRTIERGPESVFDTKGLEPLEKLLNAKVISHKKTIETY